MLLSPFLPLWTTSSPLSDSLQSIFNGSSQAASIIRGSLQSDTDVSAIKVGIQEIRFAKYFNPGCMQEECRSSFCVEDLDLLVPLS